MIGGVFRRSISVGELLVFIDNKEATALANNLLSSARAKHIDVRSISFESS